MDRPGFNHLHVNEWTLIYKALLCKQGLGYKYLHTIDFASAHAAAAVNQEDKFAMNFPQVRADRFEVRAKVQHDHRIVEDVFM